MEGKGRAALLSSVFTVRDKKIVTVNSGMKMLFPSTGEPRKPAGAKKQNSRRRYWLEYICAYISALQERYGTLDESALRGRRRPSKESSLPAHFKRPSTGMILEWFLKNTSISKLSERTILRDINGFSEFEPKKDKTQHYDKRDALISGIWAHIDDPKVVLHPNTLKVIVDEMAKLEAPQLGCYAETAATAKTAFEDDANSNGRNPTRTIAVDSGLDIDKDLR